MPPARQQACTLDVCVCVCVFGARVYVCVWRVCPDSYDVRMIVCDGMSTRLFARCMLASMSSSLLL
jgi:hypothetical protein